MPKPVLVVPGLSETQVHAIALGSEYSELADNYRCIPCDVYFERTLAALERKGFLHAKNADGGRWLTQSGRDLKDRYWAAYQERYPDQFDTS